jgi:hypothetical protein
MAKLEDRIYFVGQILRLRYASLRGGPELVKGMTRIGPRLSGDFRCASAFCLVEDEVFDLSAG